MTTPASAFDHDTCQAVGCTARSQHLLEIELSSGDLDHLAFCVIHTFLVVSRDAGENVEVVGP